MTCRPDRRPVRRICARHPLARTVRSSVPSILRSAALLLPIVTLTLAAEPAGAAAWTVSPSIGLEETLTDNVNLAPSDLAKGDFVTQITPTLAFSGLGAHARLIGSISLPVVLYARTGSENNNVYPLVSVLGNAEVVEKLFFLDGAISVTQPFLTPFGAQPSNLSSGTQNRYTASSYRVTPYVQGVMPGNVEYELRNNSIWANENGAPISTNNSFTNEWLGHLASPVAPLGWFADLDAVDVKFSNQSSQRMNLVRGGARYAYDAQIRLEASGGYEDNNFPLTNYRGFTYGAGIEWRPSERTTAFANVGHRFFGTSYLATLDHRTPLTVWNLSASRNITNYPQQLAAPSPATSTSVDGLLNQLFVSRIPSPTPRQDAVNSYLQDQGLPSSLTGAVNFYSQQILLTENFSATAGLTGVRNNIFVTFYYVRNQPIAGSGQLLPVAIDSGNNNTQLGTNLVWTHRLTPVVNLNLSVFAQRTEAIAPLTGLTNQGGTRLEISRMLSAYTKVFGGVRYQVLRSDVTTDYKESAVFAGLDYTFK